MIVPDALVTLIPFMTDGALRIAARPPAAPFRTSLAIAFCVSSSYLETAQQKNQYFTSK